MATINQRSPVFGVNVGVWEEGPLKLLNAALYHMNAVAANIDLVPSATYPIEKPWSVDVLDLIRVKRISLILQMTAKNTSPMMGPGNRSAPTGRGVIRHSER